MYLGDRVLSATSRTETVTDRLESASKIGSNTNSNDA
jgi:hypothetical protein